MAAGDLEARLRVQSERYLTILERLAERISGTMAMDTNEAGTPSRDWNRSFQNYSKGMLGLLQEQRERTKLKLLAGKTGQVPLTDEEYAAEMAQLGLQAVRELPERELRAELERRGVRVLDSEESED